MKKMIFIFVGAAIAFSGAAEAKKKDVAERKIASIKGYACQGTEPFFSLNINGNNIEYTSPELKKPKIYRSKGPVDAHGVSSGNVVSYRAAGGTAVATLLSSSLAGDECSDGMSDKEYAYHMTFVTSKSTLYGCCEPLAQD